MSGSTFPVLVGEIVSGALGGLPDFPFRSWAQDVGFEYPEDATDFLSGCGSAAEAYFIRPFTQRPGVKYVGGKAKAQNLTLQLQVLSANYRIDAVVTDKHSSLAIEIDGMAFHHRTKDQIAKDYLRQRRIVLKGHTVIRFTAQEVFGSPSECWRQVEAILDARRPK